MRHRKLAEITYLIAAPMPFDTCRPAREANILQRCFPFQNQNQVGGSEMDEKKGER